MLVKLTVSVPDDLRRRAHAVAALRGESLSEVVREALTGYVIEAIEDARDARELDALERKLDAGEAPLYEHDAVWAEIEALERSGGLPD
jgi:predicted transcriptional regulator